MGMDYTTADACNAKMDTDGEWCYYDDGDKKCRANGFEKVLPTAAADSVIGKIGAGIAACMALTEENACSADATGGPCKWETQYNMCQFDHEKFMQEAGGGVAAVANANLECEAVTTDMAACEAVEIAVGGAGQATAGLATVAMMMTARIL